MPHIEESWDPVAKTLGFENEAEMLKQLYIQQAFSLHDIGKMIGAATWTVRNRLIKQEIPLRARGGPNHSGKRKLAALSNEELFGNPIKLAAKYNVHISTISSERRLRKCNSAQSVQQSTSTDSQPTAAPISSSQTSMDEIFNMLNGTETEET